MTTSNQALEMIQYWVAQEDSEQKEVVLAYWAKQASKFARISRTVLGNSVVNTTKEKKEAFKALATRYGVPAKKAGETVSQQAYRLADCKGHKITIEERIAAL